MQTVESVVFPVQDHSHPDPGTLESLKRRRLDFFKDVSPLIQEGVPPGTDGYNLNNQFDINFQAMYSQLKYILVHLKEF